MVERVFSHEALDDCFRLHRCRVLSGCRGAGLLPAQPPVVPTAAITASPATVAPGSTATLSWTTAYASTVTIDNGIGVVAAQDRWRSLLHPLRQYTLTATSTTALPPPPRLLLCTQIPPTAKLTAAPTTITAGNSATLTWSTTNTTSVSIDNGIGTVAASGSTTVSPTTTTTYTLTANGSGGVLLLRPLR